MAGAGLSYDQGPPLGLPLRFFLAAPVFLLSAAAGAIYAGPEVFQARWNPATLALTHLLTLGFLGMVMIGALLQMLPVVIGVRIPAVRRVARTGWWGLSAGIVMLASGLVLGSPNALTLAALLIAVGLLPLLGAMLVCVTRSNVVSIVAWPMRQAWLALLLVLAIGVWLALGLAGHVPLPDLSSLTDLHLAWGLGGWILIIVTGVAYQVVPMLLLTPPYPSLAERSLTWIMLAGLAGFSVARALPGAPGLLVLATESTMAAAAFAFAAVTLWLQARRRRKLTDVTLWFWRFGMISLAACGLMLPFARSESLNLLLGRLFLLGFAASVICGMLYKIVPFLAWFHLQAQRQNRSVPIPNMKQFIPENMARDQLVLHGTGTALCVAAPWLPWPVVQFGLVLLMGSAGLLWLNLYLARRRFLANGGRL